MNPPFVIFVIGLVLELVWFVTLLVVLERKNWSDVDRIVWTVAVCTLNFLGAILYMLLAPPDPVRKFKPMSDQELAERCNNNALKFNHKKT